MRIFFFAANRLYLKHDHEKKKITDINYHLM